MVWERYRLLLPLPTSIVQHGNIRFRASFGFSFNVIALDKQRATSSTRKDGTTSSTHVQQQGPTAPIINLQYFLEINLIAKKIFHDSNKNWIRKWCRLSCWPHRFLLKQMQRDFQQTLGETLYLPWVINACIPMPSELEFIIYYIRYFTNLDINKIGLESFIEYVIISYIKMFAILARKKNFPCDTTVLCIS